MWPAQGALACTLTSGNEGCYATPLDDLATFATTATVRPAQLVATPIHTPTLMSSTAPKITFVDSPNTVPCSISNGLEQCRLPSFSGLPPPNAAVDGMKTILDADMITVLGHGKSIFKGNVTVVKDRQRLVADKVIYNRNTGTLRARGHLAFALPTVQAQGTHGYYSLDTGRGTFYDAHYRLPITRGRGHAQKIELTGPESSTLHDVTYTTCPLDQTDWVLTSSTINLDQNDEEGTAYNAVLWFYHVPVFYSPFISFPLTDKRKTGFLSPTFGYSKHDGIEIIMPYYFNIGSNVDATVTPRYIGRRGLLTTGQFRYLLPGTSGNISYSLIPNDKLAGMRRSRFHFGDTSQLGSHWRFGADINHVSDPNYFEDLDNGARASRRLFQVSSAHLRYNSPDWSFRTLLQTYQTLTPNRAPYRILPQFVLGWNPSPENRHLMYGVNSQLTRFAYPGRISATRLHIAPQMSYSFGEYDYAWHVKPALQFDVTKYELGNVHTNRPTQLTRAAPIFSLDSGLTLVRNTSFDGIVETLEPRLRYLYVPYRDQSNIPLFDTGKATFNFSQLYSNDRFTGLDRLGDTNQLSYGLTTRFIHPDTGRELLSASLGQILYFRDRRVRPHGGAPLTRPTSDIIAEASFNLNQHWSANAFVQWNQKTRRTDVESARLQYKDGARRVVNLAYRYHHRKREETDFSFAWPVARNWQFVGRWQYSLSEQATRQMFYGFEYENCCWAFVFVNRHYLRGNRLSQAYYLELQFKGLGRLGRNIMNFVKHGILGFGG